MKLKMTLIVMSVLCLTGLANAQGFAAVWYWYEDGDGPAELPLTDACPGGTPLPDGTTVRIYWDNDSNGPDDDDPQPTLCNNPPECLDGPIGTVNRNQFTLNGEAALLGAGYFAMEASFQSVAGLPPEPQRYYLRVCSGNMRWESDVKTLVPGGQEFGPSSFAPNNYTWTCSNVPCGGCQSPLAPSNFVASDTLCNGVQLTWNYPGDVEDVNMFRIFRAGVSIATITDTSIHSYLDTNAPVGTQSYGIYAHRFCDPDTAVSTTVLDNGTRLASPPTPADVAATDNTCNQVTVSWTYINNAGLGYWVITRDGDSVGTVAGGGTPGARQFVHVTALSGAANYCVYGASTACGWGTPGCDNGTALQPPPQPTGVNATDGNCNSTTITWIDVAGETGYQVWRSLENGNSPAIIANLGVNAVQHIDATGGCSTVYRYWVVATSTCGNSPAAVFDLGHKICVPSQVTGVIATDSTLCDRVTITWNDVTTETGYQIRRDGNPIDSVDANLTSFTDTTAVPGTNYQYSVVAYNTCDNGNPSASNSGSRKALPSQVLGVSATDANCNNVTITWTNPFREDSIQVRRDGLRIGVTAANGTSFVDNTAVPGVIYAYTVIAYNSCGAGPESAPDNGALRPFLFVTGVSATDADCDAVIVSWNNPSGEDSFQVRRDGVRIGVTLVDNTTYADTTALIGITYAYTVVGYNICGAGPESTPDLGSRSSILPGPDNLTWNPDVCSAIELSWSDIAEEDSFQIRRDGAWIGSTMADVTTFTDTTVTPWTQHSYVVIGYEGLCEGLPSEELLATAGVTPSAPAGVQATDSSCTSITITWNDVAHETDYIVRRNGVAIAFVPEDTTSYVDTPVPGTSSYRVQALNECGASLTSVADNGTRFTAPQTPFGLVQSGDNCGVITISWTNPALSHLIYIYRSDTLTDSVLVPTSSYDDSVGVAGSYTYYLIAANHCGLSDTSAGLIATAAQFPLTPENVTATDNDCDEVVVEWSPSPGIVDYYIIYRDGMRFDSVAGTTTLFVDSTIVSGYSYSYAVSTLSNSCGETVVSAEVIAEIEMTTPPAAPQVVITIDGNDALLNWNSVTETSEGCPVNVTGYLVFYSPTSEGTYYYHGFTSDTTYTHVRAAQFTETMFYQVVAYTGEVNWAGLEEGMEMEAALEAMSEESKNGYARDRVVFD